MKKNIQTKALLILASFLTIQTSIFASNDVVEAIHTLDTNVNNTLHKFIPKQFDSLKQQIKTQFDGYFIGDKNNLIGTFDKKICLYIKNFYKWYTNESFPTLIFSNSKYSAKDSNVSSNEVKSLLDHDIYYNNASSYPHKNLDTRMLLAQPIEPANNNIPYETLGLKSNSKEHSPFGGLSKKNLTTTITNDTFPTISDLVNPDTYSDKKETNGFSEEDKAKLLLSYLLKAAPPPKTVSIPPGEAKIIVPLQSTESPKNKGDHYNTFKVKIEENLTRKDDGSKTSHYDAMLNYLNKAKFYQDYKMATRISNMLRTVYTKSIFKMFAERSKGADGKSMVEKEKKMATEGLYEEYYTNMKNKSMAEVNLEMLRAINKLTYLVYKLHQDNEHISLLLSGIGIKSTAIQTSTQDRFLKQISNILDNQCWMEDLQDIDMTKEQKAACANPEMPNYKQ